MNAQQIKQTILLCLPSLILGFIGIGGMAVNASPPAPDKIAIVSEAAKMAVKPEEPAADIQEDPEEAPETTPVEILPEEEPEVIPVEIQPEEAPPVEPATVEPAPVETAPEEVFTEPDTPEIIIPESQAPTEQTPEPITAEPEVETYSTEVSPQSDVILVWVSDDGKKYHKKSDCSNMQNNVRQVTIEEAKEMGRDACKRCHPPE